MIMVPLLATILVSQVVHAIGEPSLDARVTATNLAEIVSREGFLAGALDLLMTIRLWASSGWTVSGSR
jgi:hypothetical protein